MFERFTRDPGHHRRRPRQGPGTPSCSPGTCSAPSGEAPSPCPPWNTWRAKSAGPSDRTWGAENLVTAALAQITPARELTIVNCGHHPPLLRHRGDLQPLTDGKAALPLGLEDDFTAFTATWSPGDRLLLYTDGLVESRDAHGHFLPEDAIKTALLASGCDQALDTLMRAVDKHTGGHAHDDMALLLLESGVPARSSANGHLAAVPAAAVS